MKFLMYCIFTENSIEPPHSLVGVNRSPVRIISCDGLAAAVSVITQKEIPRDPATGLDYHKVIQWFHERIGVIPLRLGTCLGHESDVVQLLHSHGARYKSLLKELDGCVEMGIRVIHDRPGPQELASKSPFISRFNGTESGTDYLMRRKVLFDADEFAISRNREIVERYHSPFTGLYVSFKAQTSKFSPLGTDRNSVLTSLYFLIPRQSADSFRAIYGDLRSGLHERIMLSGPWPPYNFVLPEDCL
ncbi:GvpL/GvpF family gas vesicle protein [Desulfomonile tiedjei]|uniref:Gas vesicle synthesis protein GvpL/GvpF n=1 Tax=Desulfomonile tiedjei (strain ATCC 49306 / DSM 6799 / DCB-1) TaxID=706587 RepID=I4CDB2_DESTA|nr:GvpL/GvpF family gas vesicle protein [Desulfomonile tiedjei]AFM27553.1 Gas vesicle synthesis protein GvpL/GvpF [Desulfomonile tiedjei DSM 6799]